MKRSTINRAYRDALACFERHHWALPAKPKWDITDFGLGEFERYGLVLVNLALEPEYCEKVMFARRDQVTPCHAHRRKKEDIICRWGELTVQLWPAKPNPAGKDPANPFCVNINGAPVEIPAGTCLALSAGARVTLLPGVWHAFWPSSDECIIGEVSTANDDQHDNLFLDERVGRFAAIDEDEPAAVRLLNE
jgi:D-lyxose ketol-isomerase